MRPITLNDGTFLYNEWSVKEYLTSLGFDDLEELGELLFPYLFKENNWYKEMYQAQERELDGCYMNNRYFLEELEAVLDRLASGKGGTKVQYSYQIRKLAQNYLER